MQSERALDEHAARGVAGRSGDAGNTEGRASLSREALRAIAALRAHPIAAYGVVVRQRAVLEHEASGLRLTAGSLGDIRQQLATTGGVHPAQEDKQTDDDRSRDARDAIDGVRRFYDLRPRGKRCFCGPSRAAQGGARWGSRFASTRRALARRPRP